MRTFSLASRYICRISGNYNAKRKITKFAVEAGRISNPDRERMIIEKSVSNGCEVILTRSSSACLSNYQLLSDLQETENLDWSNVLIGHMIGHVHKTSTQPHKEKIDDDIKIITENFNVNRLSFLSLPYDFYKNTDLKTISSLNALLLKHPSLKIGIEFSHEALLTHDINQLGDFISLIPENYLPRLEYVIIATNAFTRSQAMRLRSIAQQHALKSIATETLKSHIRRPGNLAFDQQTSGNLSRALSTASLEAFETDVLKEFQAAMDRCITMEKQYIEKVQPVTQEIDTNDILFAYTINHRINTIHQPEEWEYIRRSQIEAKLEDMMLKLKSSNREANNWATLYKPFATNLFSSYEKLLNIRKAHQCSDIAKALAYLRDQEPNKENQLATLLQQHPFLYQLPNIILTLTASSSFDYVAGSGMVIDVKNSLDKATPELEANKVFESIDEVMHEYSAEDMQSP